MDFMRRARKAGAFGSQPCRCDHWFVSKEKVALGYVISENLHMPVLVGFYSEAKPHKFLTGFRYCLRKACRKLRKLGCEDVLASVDTGSPQGTRLLRFYMRHLGFKVRGEHEHGLALISSLEKLEFFANGRIHQLDRVCTRR